MEYKYSDITSQLINAAMEVHRILGTGFQEVIYQRAYEIELILKNLFNVLREVEMPVSYKGQVIGTRRVDFLINDLISIEIKAVETPALPALPVRGPFWHSYCQCPTGRRLASGSPRDLSHPAGP